MFTSKGCSPDITRVWYHVESQFHHVPVLAASITHYVQSSRHVGMTIVIEQYVLEPKHSWRSCYRELLFFLLQGKITTFILMNVC